VLSVCALGEQYLRAVPDVMCLDVRRSLLRRLTGESLDHVILRRGALRLRLDVVGGLPPSESAAFGVLFRAGPHLAAQLDAVRLLRDSSGGRAAGLPAALQEDLLALWAFDSRVAGISLRSMADNLLGPGYWPGDGEHRKSRVRRLLAKGEALVRAGPGPILSRTII
jgi:hypothetical protein